MVAVNPWSEGYPYEELLGGMAILAFDGANAKESMVSICL